MSRPETNELDPTRALGLRRAPSELPEGEDLIGHVIDGRYRIDALIGRGGMGSVYRGEHVAIRRTVAIKLLHASLAGIPEVHRRFEREALAIGRIAHPNCVDVSDFGRLDDGSLFLVMEYLEGQSLGELLDTHGRLSPQRVMRILRHLLRGLEHVHNAGIVHRDVKPENVVLTVHDGVPDFAKLLDFGIAKIIGADGLDVDVKLTQAGIAFGTPVYMSPEQAVGNPVDARSDLYAASVMAFEMLAGQPPFYSDDKIEVLSMHTTRPVPTINEVANGVRVPPAVEQVVRRGLEKRPGDRYGSAGEYIAAIDSALVEMAIEEDVGNARSSVTSTGAQPLASAPGGAALVEVPRPSGPITLSDEVATTEHRAMPLAHDWASDTGLGPPRPSPIRPHTRGTDARTSAPSSSLPTASRPWMRARGWLDHGHRWVILAVAAAAIAALAIIAVLVLGRDDEVSPPPAPPSPLADSAAGKLEQGDPAAAIKDLEAAGEEIANDPQAQLQLGHAYAAKRNNSEALTAYRTALALDPTLAADAALRANLAAIGADKDGAAAVSALTLAIELGDETARAKLADMASKHGDMASRAIATTAANTLGLTERVDWVSSYSLDLAQGDTCKIRKEAVSKLRALGDPRAVQALEKATFRRLKPRSKVNANACLVDDAKAAVRYLRGLAAAQTPPPTP